MSFKGKVVIVTGSSSGIGAATAELFAQHAASVVLIGRNLDKLKRVEELCKRAHASAQVLTVPADITSDADKIIQKTIEKFGKLDVLVNNAGIFRTANFMNSNINELDCLFNTNLRAVHILTKLAVPYLLKTQGNIVNVSSVAGMTAGTEFFNYRLSKAALDQFTKCLALELAPQQVRVNSVNPAVIKTDIFENQGMDKKSANEFYAAAAGRHPIGRVGVPLEVANAILYLASDGASFITGTLLPVDGGRSKLNT